MKFNVLDVFSSTILLLSGLSAMPAFGSDFSVSACGVYRAIGRLSCGRSESCHLHVREDSEAGLDIALPNPPAVDSYFDAQFVRVDLEISTFRDRSLQAHQLTSVPMRALATTPEQALTLLKEEDCRKP